MDPIEYLRAVARRWPVVLAAFIVALAAGALTMLTVRSTPVRSTPSGPSGYQATAIVLIEGGQANSTASNLKTVAALITVGKLPQQVAKALNFQGPPSALAAQVQVEPQPEINMLNITATAGEGAQAEVIANTFARELPGFLQERTRERNASRAESIVKRLNQLKSEVAALEGRLAGSPSELLRSERDAKVRQYGTLLDQYAAIASAPTDDTSVQVIQEAVAQELSAPAGAFSAPQTPKSRLAFAGIGGLIAGVVIALVLERVDTRIRTRQAAEAHFGLPVLAEIPLLRRGPRRRDRVEVTASPKSVWADTFRLLEAGVSRRLPPRGAGAAGESRNGRPPAHTILVTSPDRAEGKTTVVANLAATYASLGKEVLILSCDLRRPRVHEVFGVRNDRGLTQALQTANGATVLDGTVLPTSVGRVRLVPSGPVPDKPSELLASERMVRALEEARRRADVVILDTPPLFSSDAAHLLSQVDGVLVVARMGTTKADPAERAGELLARLGAPVMGVALNGCGGTGITFGAYLSSDLGKAMWRRPGAPTAASEEV